MKLKKQDNSTLKINSLIYQSYGLEISVDYRGDSYHIYPMLNHLYIIGR
jgi:hypothetical protein